MIKNILFDMGGVVFEIDKVEPYKRFGALGINPDDYVDLYTQKGFFLDLETGKIDADEFCRLLAKVGGRDAVSYDEAQYCWLSFVKNIPERNLNCFTRLRRKYHLCLTTNTNPFIMKFMRSDRFSGDRHPITDYFDSLFCSYEIKHCKPSADYFNYVLRADNMNTDECLFVDDSINNIRSAESLGIHGFLVEPGKDWTVALEKKLGEEA